MRPRNRYQSGGKYILQTVERILSLNAIGFAMNAGTRSIRHLLPVHALYAPTCAARLAQGACITINCPPDRFCMPYRLQ